MLGGLIAPGMIVGQQVVSKTVRGGGVDWSRGDVGLASGVSNIHTESYRLWEEGGEGMS